MPIDLTEYEKGQPFSGDYMLSLGALQARLARAQLIQFKLGRRAIIVLEGLEGSGKADILKLLATALDPRLFRTISVEPGLRNDETGHWLAPFWASLPRAGRSSFFFHSWYARVLEVPTPRWHSYVCRARGLDCPRFEMPETIRERAWTSPVWWTP